MKEINSQELLNKYKAGNCTEAEKAIVESWYLQWEPEGGLDLSDAELDKAVSRVGMGLPVRPRPKQQWLRVAVAASILVFMSIGGFFVLNRPSATRLSKTYAHDVAPGGNKAILTLSNGKKIILTGAPNGVLLNLGNLQVKTDNGHLAYDSKGTIKQARMAYDTLTTPAGGIYNITLADGSKVWLNSATSIRYPEVFDQTERKIEVITGEAYFEVVHNATTPFRVFTKKGLVEDIGTHFNINAYNDEPVERITLVEGSVSVSAGAKKVILKPGQQATSAVSGTSFAITEADTEEAIAWKNGLFLFNNEALASIMKKVGRWYDVKVEYKDEQIKRKVFLGSVSRFKNVSEVLRMLEETGNIQFEIKGPVITVSANK